MMCCSSWSGLRPSESQTIGCRAASISQAWFAPPALQKKESASLCALSGQGCSTDKSEAVELRFSLKSVCYMSRDSGRWKMGVEDMVQNSRFDFLSFSSFMPSSRAGLAIQLYHYVSSGALLSCELISNPYQSRLRTSQGLFPFPASTYRICQVEQCRRRCQLHSLQTRCTSRHLPSWQAGSGGRHTLLYLDACWKTSVWESVFLKSTSAFRF